MKTFVVIAFRDVVLFVYSSFAKGYIGIVI